MSRESPEPFAEPCPLCRRHVSWVHFDSLRNEFNCLVCRKRFARTGLPFDPVWLLRHPPNGSWLYETHEGWVAGAKADALELFIGTALVGSASFAVGGYALFSQNAPVFAIIALMLVAPVCFLVGAILRLNYIVEVERVSDRLVLRQGPRCWRGERAIPVDRIRQIYEAHTGAEGTSEFIYIVTDRWWALGQPLTRERRRWLLSVLLDRVPIVSTPSSAPPPAFHHPSAD